MLGLLDYRVEDVPLCALAGHGRVAGVQAFATMLPRPPLVPEGACGLPGVVGGRKPGGEGGGGTRPACRAACPRARPSSACMHACVQRLSLRGEQGVQEKARPP